MMKALAEVAIRRFREWRGLPLPEGQAQITEEERSAPGLSAPVLSLLDLQGAS